MRKDLLAELQPAPGPRRPCPRCGKNEARDCGYGRRDYWGEFDCEAPDADELETCDSCHHLFCEECATQHKEET